MLGLSPAQTRSYVRAGFVEPRRGQRGEYRLSFQDLVLLRAAKGLLASRIPARRLRQALQRLKERLPRGRSLSGLHISASGTEIVVRDGASMWNPASGQGVFDFGFDVGDLARKVAPLARRAVKQARSNPHRLGAEHWYDLGCDLEAHDVSEARDAYRRAVEIDPWHADAHINLGRLLHDDGEVAAAEGHYRIALARRPGDPTATFNLGVALEDLGRLDEAREAYRRTLDSDPRWADAHYNLAGLHERYGDLTAALRHLKAYKQLTAH